MSILDKFFLKYERGRKVVQIEEPPPPLPTEKNTLRKSPALLGLTETEFIDRNYTRTDKVVVVNASKRPDFKVSELPKPNSY